MECRVVPCVKLSVALSQVSREIKTEKGLSPVGVSGADGGYVDCIAVSISPDLGERISLSAERPLLEEVSNSLEPEKFKGQV